MQHAFDRYALATQFQLEALEQDRRIPRRRDLHWSGAAWDRLFDEHTQAENERDNDLYQQMIAAPIDSVDSDLLSADLDRLLEGEVAWYNTYRNDLRQLHQRWEVDSSVAPHLIDELEQQLGRVEQRYHRQSVWHMALALEHLERRRLRDGRLEAGVWGRHWQALCHAWHMQDRFYGAEAARGLAADRLAWCRRLRQTQLEAQRAQRQNRAFDHAGYEADAALLDARIAELTPPPPHQPQAWNWLFTVGAAVVLIVFGLWMWTTNGAASRSETANVPAQPRSTDAPSASLFTGTGPSPAASAPAIVAQPAPSATAVPPRDPIHARDLNKQGVAAIARGDCTAAIQQLRDAIAADPAFYEPPNNLAFCVYEQGDAQQALDLWDRALSLNDRSADAHAGRALALLALGRSDEARQSYTRALEIKAEYGNDEWLRTTAFWSQKAIADSAPLRQP